jgi:uncharacterized cupin superfamily protein
VRRAPAAVPRVEGSQNRAATIGAQAQGRSSVGRAAVSKTVGRGFESLRPCCVTEWFVVNAREAEWFHNELGAYCPFESRDDRFEQLGVNISVLPPGKPMAMYHEEADEEAFFVVRGECTLIVEGEERPLRQWDFFWCPPWTKHVIVGAGAEPSVVLAVGARGRKGLNYPFDEVAVKYGAGPEQETSDPREAYARFSQPQPGVAPEDL